MTDTRSALQIQRDLIVKVLDDTLTDLSGDIRAVFAERDRLLADKADLLAAARCVVAALSQASTYPADIVIARNTCSRAIDRTKE